MATLVELRCEIATRMHQGESFSSIEDDVIETSDMSDDQKSALWLYGWSFVALRGPATRSPRPPRAPHRTPRGRVSHDEPRL